jgi:hypothetical protein
MVCSGCGPSCERVHDWEERWVQDLPIKACLERTLGAPDLSGLTLLA